MSQKADLIVKQCEEGIQYHQSMDFKHNWPEYENMKIGNQWPRETEKTRNLPRPVFNIIKFILSHKKASVLNENLKLVFRPQEVPMKEEDLENEMLNLSMEGSEMFTRFAETVWEDIGQDELNEDLADDASTLGTGILHYYWDSSEHGGLTKKYKGNMKGEVLDPSNVFFGNPQIRDEQKQPYIIISSRESVEAVKKLAKKNGVSKGEIELIQPDNDVSEEIYDAGKIELSSSDKVTVLTKYEKKNGKIVFTKVACGVVIQDEEETELTLYPIVVLNWEKRKKSIYGVSEVEGLIPNQKAINFIIAMMILSVQNTAWPKLVVKNNALQQDLLNIPGEIVHDRSMVGGDNIKYLQGIGFSNTAPLVTDKIFELTRNLAGANEAVTGEPFTSQLNASAIIALQKASAIPVEQIRKRFYRAIEKVGRIYEDFFKVKYNMERKITVYDDEGEEMTVPFTGSDYTDVPLKLKVDVGVATNFGEALAIATLDKLLELEIATPEDYLEFAPKNIIPFKEKLLERWKKRQGIIPPEQPAIPKQPNISEQLPDELMEDIPVLQQQQEILTG